MDSTDLCLSCGLCCNGVLFNSAIVEESELPELEAVNLSVFVGSDGCSRFDQPCPNFIGGRCGVYARRPTVCRSFRCELLKKVEAGEVTSVEASARISEAKSAVQSIASTLGRGQAPTPRLFNAMLREWQSKSSEERASQSDSALLLQIARLNRLLDVHFRQASQYVLRSDR